MTGLRRVVGGLAGAAVLAVAGCSSGTGELSKSASDVLKPQVQNIRNVVAQGDYAEVRNSVRDFEAQVRQLAHNGEMSGSRMAALLDAADTLLRDAKQKLSPSPTPTPTTESPTPTPTQTTESPTPTPTPTPTTESPTPTPTPTTVTTSASPLLSASTGNGQGNGNGQGGGRTKTAAASSTDSSPAKPAATTSPG